MDNLMIGVQLADVSTACSSHPQGNNICFLSTATATEKDICILEVLHSESRILV